MMVSGMSSSFFNQLFVFIDGVFGEEVLKPGGLYQLLEENLEVRKLGDPSGYRLFLGGKLGGPEGA